MKVIIVQGCSFLHTRSMQWSCKKLIIKNLHVLQLYFKPVCNTTQAYALSNCRSVRSVYKNCEFYLQTPTIQHLHSWQNKNILFRYSDRLKVNSAYSSISRAWHQTWERSSAWRSSDTCCTKSKALRKSVTPGSGLCFPMKSSMISSGGNAGWLSRSRPRFRSRSSGKLSCISTTSNWVSSWATSSSRWSASESPAAKQDSFAKLRSVCRGEQCRSICNCGVFHLQYEKLHLLRYRVYRVQVQDVFSY